jgi:hypothetical protein
LGQLISQDPEYELLLDVVSPLAEPRVDHASWAGDRWGQVLNIADWHRLSPALYAHLEGTNGAPAAVLNALKRAYLANSARSLFLRSATAAVNSALDRAEIPAMLLKGAALVETVYADPGRREMLDIDLLVHDDRLAEATAALREIGYGPTPGPFTTGAEVVVSNGQVAVETHHDEALVGPDHLTAIELHRRITVSGEGSNFDVDSMWPRARTVPATGHLVPSPEDLLIHVCFHFTRNRLGGRARRRHTGGALAQLMDINLLVRGEAVDWDRLAGTAQAGGLGTRVFLGLFAASELGAPVPPAALARLRPVGFDPELGRRLLALRVLRAGDHLPVRSMRWMFTPSKEALRRGWNADPNATLSLARAYMRRAKAHVPEARAAMRRPWIYVQDQRLNGQIEALKERG